ncbi:DALR anticodon-binding domain-containing protein 3 isoform X1 [Schistocerca gregaria]|uniref:DALR anticodon-binding domain-containing protein 3 isoform X1 n=1 Tax=Schistocerca gregaria TaxID=7010 RepID=UPI00211E30E2|nr:DALR anticodon-binding domain-containing protein 3 isoform X1 [Schistocerca gregaria]
MDHDVINAFVENLCNHFNLTNESVKCNVRKHSENLLRDGDMSFPLYYIMKNIKENKPDCELPTATILESSGTLESISESDSKKWNLEEQLTSLKEASATWKLRIEKCEIQRNRVVIYFQKDYTFRTTLRNVLQVQHLYGSCQKRKQGIVIEASVSEGDDMDLSQLRVKYLKDFAVRAAKQSGYNTFDSSEACDCIGFILTTKSSKDLPDRMKAVICGAVVNAKSRTKETDMLAKEYLRLRESDMRTAALHKYGTAVEGDVKWNSLISSLGEAAVKMELLKVKPSQTVSLSLESDYKVSRERSSKGATFVLYNYARITSILKQFHEKEEKKLYPTLLTLDEIDFALLKCDEEWQLLHFIIVYPSIVNSLGNDLEKGILKPHVICVFLSAMCKTFSVYYRRIRILREPRQHLFPTMCARIYLLKALQITLQSSLHLMGIDTVNQM